MALFRCISVRSMDGDIQFRANAEWCHIISFRWLLPDRTANGQTFISHMVPFCLRLIMVLCDINYREYGVRFVQRSAKSFKLTGIRLN